jgi:hypothetical protein
MRGHEDQVGDALARVGGHAGIAQLFKRKLRALLFIVARRRIVNRVVEEDGERDLLGLFQAAAEMIPESEQLDEVAFIVIGAVRLAVAGNQVIENRADLLGFPAPRPAGDFAPCLAQARDFAFGRLRYGAALIASAPGAY